MNREGPLGILSGSDLDYNHWRKLNKEQTHTYNGHGQCDTSTLPPTAVSCSDNPNCHIRRRSLPSVSLPWDYPTKARCCQAPPPIETSSLTA